MEKKKILILPGGLQIGGAEKVAVEIALRADLAKFEFDYLVFGEKVGAYEQPVMLHGCRVLRMPEPSENLIQYVRNLYRLMRENRYHAVHAHTMFNCGWAMVAAKCAGVPVRIAHAHSALRNGGNWMRKVYETIMRFLILTCSTNLVACGVEAGKRLFGTRAYEKRGQLILNGIDIPGFAYDPERGSAIREACGLGNCFLLGHVGHLAAVKNQSFLLELIPLILERKENAKLILLGEGEERPKLEEKIRAMGLEERVILTGNVNNVADYLSAMDVFVFPSLFEGMPLSVLEVQANGLPCVISDGVPKDVFLTDLIHPLSLSDPKERWADAVCSAERGEALQYNRDLQASDYSAQRSMEKIYQIYNRKAL